MALSFGGSQIRRPGAYSIVDTSDMTPVQVGALKTLGFVGEAKNLNAEANAEQVMYFNSPKLAGETLGAGELLEHMKIAWGHGADLIAVSIVQNEGAGTTDEDWQKAIDRFETESVAGIVPVTAESAIHVKVDSHVTTMSSVNARKERRGFYGHEAGLKVEEVLDLQTALNSERAVIASPAVQVYGADGSKVTKPSSYLASAYAGLWAKQPVQEPITYKYVKFAGLDMKYTSVQIGELLEGGIAVTEFVEGKGLRIVQGITASASEDLTMKELSVSSLKDVMSANLRENLEEKFVGRAGVAGIEVSILNSVGSILDTYVRKGWIISYDPASVQIRKEGTAFEVDWVGEPTLPINHFFITSRFKL